MTAISIVLPLAQITFLTPPGREAAPGESGDIAALISQPLVLTLVSGIALVGFVLALLNRRAAARRAHGALQFPIFVDGSNVMHWKDETARIAVVQDVVRELKARGFSPGVVFDANAGYKLSGRYMTEYEFAKLLNLRDDQILVVPKGTQADPYLLAAARDFGARVVTRDRFRDWAEAHPEVKRPGFLIRGGYRSTGELWLEEASPVAGEIVV